MRKLIPLLAKKIHDWKTDARPAFPGVWSTEDELTKLLEQVLNELDLEVLKRLGAWPCSPF